MALTINSNIQSLYAQRSLSKTNSMLHKSIEKLSSGLRINRASDDAAGLAISTKLQAEIRSINQAMRNTNDAVSLTQVAEGGLSEQSNMLGRMRELATQASNGTLSDEQRGYLNDEYQALKEEVTRVSDTTEFNGEQLLDGSQAGGMEIQTGYQNSANDRMSIALDDVDADALGLNTAGASDLLSADSARSAMDVIDDTAMTTVNSMRSDIGSFQNRLEYTLSNLSAEAENFTAADSRIRDADFAMETANYVKNQILSQAGMSILAQANLAPQKALNLLGS